MEQRLTGVFTALVTPFRRDGSLDEPAMRKLVRRQLSAGVAGLVPCGTTGESASMATEEWEGVLRTVLEEVEGRVPVIAGAGSNWTAKAVDLSKRCERLGIDALLHVTPYYVKPTQEGLLAHYRAIAEAVATPIIVYNVPGRTGVALAPDTVLRLAEDRQFVAVKQAVADLDQASEILRGRPKHFAVLSGEDALSVPMIALGGDGVISVVSNEVPQAFVALVRAALSGDREEAVRLHARLFPLMKANFVESNPIPVKYALSTMGAIENVLRLPMTSLDQARQVQVEEALKEALDVESLLCETSSGRPG